MSVYALQVFCYNPMSKTIDLCVKPLGHFLVSRDIEERIDEVRRGLYVGIGFSKCPLSNRQNEENADIAFLRSVASTQNTDQLRTGPGFTVLRKSDNMDFS